MKRSYSLQYTGIIIDAYTFMLCFISGCIHCLCARQSLPEVHKACYEIVIVMKDKTNLFQQELAYIESLFISSPYHQDSLTTFTIAPYDDDKFYKSDCIYWICNDHVKITNIRQQKLKYSLLIILENLFFTSGWLMLTSREVIYYAFSV